MTLAELQHRDRRIAALEAIPHRLRLPSQRIELDQLVYARDQHWRRLPEQLARARRRAAELVAYALKHRLVPDDFTTEEPAMIACATGRFGHCADVARDYRQEVDALSSILAGRNRGAIWGRGLEERVQRAMEFNVTGIPGTAAARARLVEIDAQLAREAEAMTA